MLTTSIATSILFVMIPLCCDAVPKERLSIVDSPEPNSYIFSSSNYNIYHVEGVGSFYIDNGFDFLKNQLRNGYAWEPYIIELLEKYIQPGTTAIDIGAHIGTHTMTMSKCVGEMGKVIAFEPQLKLFAELSENIKLNDLTNVFPFRHAIGNFQNKKIEMNPATELSEGSTSIGSGGDLVTMITLDSINLSNVSLIKIDVEGFENEVLDGAKQTIMKNRPVIIIEIMGGYSWDTCPNHIKEKIFHTVSKLQGWNYTVTRFATYDYLATPN